jgi:hypothetical protein
MYSLSIDDPEHLGLFSTFSKPSVNTANFEPCGVGRAPAPAAMAATRVSSSSLE